MAECAHCGESIESGESYGFRVRPIGNIDQLEGVLALMGGGTDADSLGQTQRDEVLHRFGH